VELLEEPAAAAAEVDSLAVVFLVDGSGSVGEGEACNQAGTWPAVYAGCCNAHLSYAVLARLL
jgi:hypothetical protein